MIPLTDHDPGPRVRDTALAGLALAVALALAYGPAKLAGHIIYTGVIQDVTNLYGFFCWDEFSRAEILAGRFPLWNPHNAFGVPHLANMQTAVFYPLNWLKWACGFWPVIDLILMLRLWVAGLSTYLLARSALKTGFFPSLLGALGFMLSGHMTRYVYMSHLNVETLLPLQALLMLRLARRPDTRRLAAAGLGFAVLVLGGFPEATLYAVGLSMGYYLFNVGDGISRRKIAPRRALPREILFKVWPGVTALAVGLAVSAPQWLPFGEYYAQAWTYHVAGSGLRHYDPRLAIALVLPWFFGENNISPAAPFLPPYLGLAVAAPALALLWGLRRAGRQAVFFAGSGVVLLGVMYGLPPFALIGRVFPFSLTYNDKYSVPALTLCACLAAAAGLTRLGRRGPGVPAAGPAAGPVAVIAAGIAVSAVMGYANWFSPLWALGLKYSPLMLPTAAVFVTGLLVLSYGRARGRLSRRAFEAGAAALGLAVLLLDLRGHTPVYHDRLPDPVGGPDLKKTLTGPWSEFRVHADPDLEPLRADRFLAAGLDDLRSYDPLYPRTYVEFMAAAGDLAGDTLQEHYHRNMVFALERDRIGGPLAGLANAGFFILPTALDERPQAREWARSARTRGPRPESWLRAEEVMAGGHSETALIDHAPVRMTVSLPELPEGVRGLLWDAGVPDDQVFAPGYRGDGVFLSAMITDRRSSLAYARYFDAKRRRDDLGWRAAFLRGARGEVSLAMLPGPRDDQTRDAAAWGRPRVKTAAAEPGFTRVDDGSGPYYIYRNDRAFERVTWVAGAAPLPPDSAPGVALTRMAGLGPGIFKALALIAGPLAGPVSGDTVSVSSEYIKVLETGPGRRVMESSRARAGLAVAAEQYFPGFRATVEPTGEDGRRAGETKIYRADVAFQAALVPGGSHRVTIEYQPWAFRVGLWFGLVSVVLVLLAMVKPMAGRLV